MHGHEQWLNRSADMLGRGFIADRFPVDELRSPISSDFLSAAQYAQTSPKYTHPRSSNIQRGEPTGRRGDEIALPATQPDLTYTSAHKAAAHIALTFIISQLGMQQVSSHNFKFLEFLVRFVWGFAIHLARGTAQLRVLVNTGISLRVHKRWGIP